MLPDATYRGATFFLTWNCTHLVWEPERVAVTSRGAAESSLGRPADGWHVFYVEEIGDGIDPVVESLRKEG